MNFRTLNIIIRREYLNKVKKKSFLVITFVVPILFAALCTLPSIIMMGAKEATKEIAVIDKSGIVMPMLTNTETAHYRQMDAASMDSVKADMTAFGVDAVLVISELDPGEKILSAEVSSAKPLGIDLTENINSRINEAVENYRIDSYGIEGLGKIMEDVKTNIRLKSYTLDKDGRESISESGVYMAVSMILGMIIYMFIALFGGMVMSSVIEEKASRVVEVLISSVKATELMFGKIIGVALVALTQFFLWIALGAVLLAGAGAIAGPDLLQDLAESQNAAQIGSADMGGVNMTPSVDLSETNVIFNTVSNLPLTRIFVSFVLFFIFGYLLYASMFAAIGSAVENEADTQQLQIPLTIPLLLGFFVALYAFKAPDSPLVLWGSMIPFTSPIVMLARIPFGVPVLELVISLVLLVLTFVFCGYLSAKVYKVGILMFGKKSTWADLWKWLKQK